MTTARSSTKLLIALLALTIFVVSGCGSVRSSMETSSVNSSSELGPATAISVSGGNTLCAVFQAGTAYCWENSPSRQEDNDPASDPIKKYPIHELMSDADISDISVNEGRVCALLKDETVRCLGMNEPILTNASMISTGNRHSCAVLTDGSAQCWGNNDHGQLGDGSNNGSSAPVEVQGLTNIAKISAGRDHTCATLTDGTAHCWGMNRTGLLGNDSTLDSPIPVQVKELNSVTEISAGETHTCTVTQNGAAHCWGDNNYDNKLGPTAQASSGGYQREPAEVTGIDNVSTIAAGQSQTCAALQDGSVYCWGAYDRENTHATTGTLVGRSEPTQIEGLSDVTNVAAGHTFACALLQDGSVYCWGNEFAANLGDGTTGDPTAPVQVSFTE